MAKLPEYQSLEEKREYFSYHKNEIGDETLITKKEEFDFFHSAYLNAIGKNVYRGLYNSRYKLFTSGQRFWITNELEKRISGYSEFISNIIKLTKEENGGSIAKFLQRLMDKEDDLAILSFIQHHGGPTPLLDFTSNIDVALYFATHPTPGTATFSNDQIDNYFCIYVLPLLADTEDTKNVNFWAAPWRILQDRFNALPTDELKQKAYAGMRSIDTYLGALIGPYSKIGLIDQDFARMFKMHYITNMNILNQEGAFFFVNDATMPLDEIIENNYNTGRISNTSPKFVSCVHIHKNLIPYVKTKSSVKENYIFPNSYDMMRNVCNNAMLL